jgi:protein TonB
MTRTSVSFLLSAVLHAALLTLFAIPGVREEPVVVRGPIRVTFNALGRGGGSSVSGAQKIEPVPTLPPTFEKEVRQAIPQRRPINRAKETPSKPPVTQNKKTQREKNSLDAMNTARTDPPLPVAAPPQKGGVEAGSDADGLNAGALKGGAAGTSGATPSAVDVQALKITKKLNPEYPVLSRKRREQGTVVLLAEIVSGAVKSVEIERSSGHPPLDESAVRAAKQWAFEMSGLENRVIARIPFKFELK